MQQDITYCVISHVCKHCPAPPWSSPRRGQRGEAPDGQSHSANEQLKHETFTELFKPAAKPMRCDMVLHQAFRARHLKHEM